MTVAQDPLPTPGDAAGETRLETRVTEVGRGLLSSLSAVIEALPDAPRGPQALSADLGLDKVLASRVLKALRASEPMAVVHAAPGPEPMRRLVRAAARRGVPSAEVDAARAAIDDFEHLIKRDVGDRSALDAILSAWLPEARRDFELRRKQALFRAVSQLHGASAETCLSCVLLHPAADGTRLDVVWVIGFLGLQRLRPGVHVTTTSRRITSDDAPRHPATLDGVVTEDIDAYRLDAFCHAPPTPVKRRRIGGTMRYLMDGDAFGPGSGTDFILSEVNLAEMPRYVPADSGRRGYVFAETATPSKRLLFDAFVHEDVYPGRDPQLLLHDTAYEGVADLNDPAREADRMQLMEQVRHLGRGTAGARDTSVPRYAELLRHVFDRLGWDEQAFRGYRCAIDYPVYGMQTSMAFDPPSG